MIGVIIGLIILCMCCAVCCVLCGDDVDNTGAKGETLPDEEDKRYIQCNMRLSSYYKSHCSATTEAMENMEFPGNQSTAEGGEILMPPPYSLPPYTIPMPIDIPDTSHASTGDAP